MATVKILDSRQFPDPNPARRGQPARLVIFEVDGKAEQRYYVTLPSANPSESEIQAAVKAEIAARASHVGKTFAV